MEMERMAIPCRDSPFGCGLITHPLPASLSRTILSPREKPIFMAASHIQPRLENPHKTQLQQLHRHDIFYIWKCFPCCGPIPRHEEMRSHTSTLWQDEDTGPNPLKARQRHKKKNDRLGLLSCAPVQKTWSGILTYHVVSPLHPPHTRPAQNHTTVSQSIIQGTPSKGGRDKDEGQ